MAEFISGLICEACGDPILKGQNYTTIKDNMPNQAKHIFHAEHAPTEGPTRTPRHFGLQAEPGGPKPEGN